MIYKTFGRTGLKVSAVGFGGMRFDTKLPKEQNARLLLYARDKGINYFDTAPMYCEDTSEEIFGLAIEQMAAERDRFYVTTKKMPSQDDTYDSVRQAVEKSLKRLRTDYIDFYHVWCIRTLEQYRWAMKPGGEYEALCRLKEDGLVKNIVISTHLLGSDVCEIIKNDEYEGVLLGVNVLNFRYRWAGVQAADKAGWGVVAMNPMAGGLIPQNAERFAFLANRQGQTPMEAAISFLVSCPQITVALNGFTTKEHIDMACRAADAAKPYTDEDIQRIRDHTSKNMNMLCTGCQYCMEHCPKDIPISNYMQFYNDKLLTDKTTEQLIEHTKFNHQWGILASRKVDAGECVACGRCELACTQHLPIIKRLQEIDQWEQAIKDSGQ